MTTAQITSGLKEAFDLTATGVDELDGELKVPVDGEVVGEVVPVGELVPPVDEDVGDAVYMGAPERIGSRV